MKLTSVLILFIFPAVFAQNYTSYFSGNTTNIVTNPKGGICLMGGATEHDEAMKWFLQQAAGGDILVLRASGADGYNEYMLNDLGINVNSVETIVCHNASASDESYLQDKISQAEAIWFAGGDQWNYISYWRNTPAETLINQGLQERKIVIGGTSAGMAIQGGFYFSAENGSVTSSAALANPYNPAMTVSNEGFIENEFMEDVITDTHYDDPDRKGRHIAFLARMLEDSGVRGKGIACDEYTAVCIDSLGFCKIYGDYPDYDEDVYFLQVNCELADAQPEVCQTNASLTWNHGGQAVKVYHAKGTMQGTQTFNLSDWQTGDGGVWENWYVDHGTLIQVVDDAPNCSLGQNTLKNTPKFVFQNPVQNASVTIPGLALFEVKLLDATGREQSIHLSDNELFVSHLPDGVYFLQLNHGQSTDVYRLVLKR
ncbi:MAG: cyanophycinase [Crocinitomicaceae bacterium]|jgi:cyanophycinase-like exopeptidase|nr:cyanophycinase [Crocinitomicaceae bacterium]